MSISQKTKTSQLDADTDRLMQAAARLVATAVNEMSADDLNELERALSGGVYPAVEVVPNPAAPQIRVVLVDVKGTRHALVQVQFKQVNKCLH